MQPLTILTELYFSAFLIFIIPSLSLFCQQLYHIAIIIIIIIVSISIHVVSHPITSTSPCFLPFHQSVGADIISEVIPSCVLVCNQ